MGKGNKQRGNREAKKPKADKKLAPVSSTFLRPQADAPKPGDKVPVKIAGRGEQAGQARLTRHGGPSARRHARRVRLGRPKPAPRWRRPRPAGPDECVRKVAKAIGVGNGTVSRIIAVLAADCFYAGRPDRQSAVNSPGVGAASPLANSVAMIRIRHTTSYHVTLERLEESRISD